MPNCSPPMVLQERLSRLMGKDLVSFVTLKIIGSNFRDPPRPYSILGTRFYFGQGSLRSPFRSRDGDQWISKTGSRNISVKNVRITSLDPSQAEAGSLLTVVGEHFGNTAGSRDPNTMFGVNQVLINGIRAEVRRWRPTKIEVLIPANAKTGDVEVRLASSDPLPDGSCCAPVEYAVSNKASLTVIPSITFDPPAGPIGSKVVLSGQDLGQRRPEDGQIFIWWKASIGHCAMVWIEPS